MSEMLDWAKEQIKLAKENNNDEYFCACCDSALKAFKTLCNVGHSGCSIQMTKNILDRLIDIKPLVALEDKEENWNDITWDDTGRTIYQHKQCSSVFKDVFLDGTVKYSDNHRVSTYYNNNNIPWHCGTSTAIIDDLYPITFPYMPGDNYKVYANEYKSKHCKGDYDAQEILYYIMPDGTKKKCHRYFVEQEDGHMQEVNWFRFFIYRLRAKKI